MFAFFNYWFKPSPFAKSWLRANRQRFQIFHPTISLSHKNFLFGKILMTSFHVICALGFPQSKILGTPMNWRSPEKNFWRLFLENTCACVLGPWPWAFLSFASRGFVLGKAVLGLGFFVSLVSALASSLVSSTPPLLKRLRRKKRFVHYLS